jgi:hypothetical protein
MKEGKKKNTKQPKRPSPAIEISAPLKQNAETETRESRAPDSVPYSRHGIVFLVQYVVIVV